MIHTQYAAALRQTMLRAMGPDARQQAQARRPGKNPFSEVKSAPLGAVRGYRYRSKSPQTALMLGIPGELAGDLDSEWFMDLTPGLPIEIKENDTLTFENGDTRRVGIVRGSGQFTGRDIYRLYKLEVI